MSKSSSKCILQDLQENAKKVKFPSSRWSFAMNYSEYITYVRLEKDEKSFLTVFLNSNLDVIIKKDGKIQRIDGIKSPCSISDVEAMLQVVDEKFT